MWRTQAERRRACLCGAELEEECLFKLLAAGFDADNATAHIEAQRREAGERTARVAALPGLPAETKSRLIRDSVLSVLLYAPLAYPVCGALGAIDRLQSAVDSAVRGAAHGRCMATELLRLPAASGGLGVPDLREELAAARVATGTR